MTKKEKQLWLEAIEKLREYYARYGLKEVPRSYEVSTGNECPLCVCVASEDSCEDCLWLKLEGISCSNKPYYLDSTQARLDRLDRWEARILKGDC